MNDAELLEDAAGILARLEKDGDPFNGDDWSLVQILRRVPNLVAQHARLREALSWAVGFIQCNYPKTSAGYEDFRNASDLVKDDPAGMFGEFHNLSCRAEFAESELARLRELLAGAYTVKPLEWKNTTPNLWEADSVEVHYAYGNWFWTRYDDGYEFDEDCTDLADGQRKAEAWRLAGVTAPLVKVEVPS